MPGPGHIHGRVSADRTAYELVQAGKVRQTIPIAEVHANGAMRAAIIRNKWEMP